MDLQAFPNHEFSIALCFALGALHALEPGHGKTALAAHVLSEKGIFRPFVIASSTAFSHSISILVVAALVHGTLDLSFQESHGLGFYRGLNLASGVLLLAVGIWIFYSSKQRKVSGHVHTGNCCGPKRKLEELPTISLTLRKPKSSFNTVLIGFAVGLVPCPTALVALSQALIAKDWLTVAVVTFTFAAGIFTSLFIVGGFLGLKVGPAIVNKFSFKGSGEYFSALQASVICFTGAWHLYLGI